MMLESIYGSLVVIHWLLAGLVSVQIITAFDMHRAIKAKKKLAVNERGLWCYTFAPLAGYLMVIITIIYVISEWNRPYTED